MRVPEHDDPRPEGRVALDRVVDGVEAAADGRLEVQPGGIESG